jgi:hypothetical protein
VNRAELYYQQLDTLRPLHQQARKDLLAEAAKHSATKLLREIPFIGPIRAALLIAILQTPHRFRTKRQLWTYSGFGIETHGSAEHRYVEGELQRSKKPISIRGLNRNHNHDLKNLFKSAATVAAAKARPVPGVLRCAGRQGDQAGDGAADPGAQDRCDYLDRLEERSPLRRPIFETTNSLSVSGNPFHLRGCFLAVASRVLEILGIEGESQLIS